jgi:tetratricopeptide (TPR) repeat protein
VVFLPALLSPFITYDDPVYVTQNPHVTNGLTWAGLWWAFTSTEASNWHPLTWVSHMADVQLFGLRPWGHHATSVILHALNASLLFYVLRRITGAPWRSAVVAALFGLHPLHVESVAWIAERKDVLSGTFFMLTLAAYASYTAAPAGGRKARFRYLLALVLFAMGLMCKPMLVTLPFVLLLLDFWPLRRLTNPRQRPALLLMEKLPFIALSAGSCAMTLYAQAKGGAIATVGDFPLGVRVANALVVYCKYLGKSAIPRGLSIFYPSFGEAPPFGLILAAAFAITVATAIALALIRKAPYLTVGWLWYLGTLVPVIGLVQVGGQVMADRYTYIPLVGIFIAAVWAVGDLAAPWPRLRVATAILGGGAVIACAAASVHQLSYWRSGEALFRHAAAVTKDNWVAHANLYATLSKTGQPEAQDELRKTMNILAGFAERYDRLGAELERKPGHSAEAIVHYRTAVRIMPDLARTHEVLAAALARTPGGMPEAVSEFREGTRLDPDSADTHFNLATALASTPKGRAEAISEYETATTLGPDNFTAHFNLAFLLSSVPGREREALSEYADAVRIRPQSVEAHFNLGLTLARFPDRRQQSIAEFEQVLKLRPGLPEARRMITELQ